MLGDYPPGCTICSSPVRGHNIGYTPDDTISYNFFCGEVENSRWYTFSTGRFNSIEITLTILSYTTGDGLEMAIFDENLNVATSCASLKNGNSITLVYRLNTNQTYQILIDGIDGDECEFELFVNSNPGGDRRELEQSPADQNYCIGVEVCFEIEPDILNEQYYWNLPSSDSIISGGGIDDTTACLYFKTSGQKDISVDIETPCGNISNFSNPILIKEGQSIAVDTIYSRKPLYCRGDTVEFYVDWDNPNNLGLDWHYQTPIDLSGRTPKDTFLKGLLLGVDTFVLSVTPIDECGFIYSQEVPVVTNFISVLSVNVCEGYCFQLADSCYFESAFGTINTGLFNSLGCDSLVRLTVNSLSVLPSPLITCKRVQDDILVEWEGASAATEYQVFLNRDSFATTTDNFIFIKNIPIDSSVNVKVQPFGTCDYLPAEITCTNSITNTNNNFSGSEIVVYPNPTTGKIKVETNLKVESIEVYDVAGRFLQKEKTTSFELVNQKSGIYFLKIKTKRNYYLKRIVVH